MYVGTANPAGCGSRTRGRGPETKSWKGKMDVLDPILPAILPTLESREAAAIMPRCTTISVLLTSSNLSLNKACTGSILIPETVPYYHNRRAMSSKQRRNTRKRRSRFLNGPRIADRFYYFYNLETQKLVRKVCIIFPSDKNLYNKRIGCWRADHQDRSSVARAKLGRIDLLKYMVVNLSAPLIL